MKAFFMMSMMSLTILSCYEDDRAPEEGIDSQSVTGTWLYTERGYSPGDGYIVEPVTMVPPRTVTFSPDGTMHSDIQDLTEFVSYQIAEDVSGENLILTLRKSSDQEGSQQKGSNTYFAKWEGSTLRLYMRGCIEGCHLGFRRLPMPGGWN